MDGSGRRHARSGAGGVVERCGVYAVDLGGRRIFVAIFSGAFLKSAKVVLPRKKFLIKTKVQRSPIISREVLTGQEDLLFSTFIIC